MDIQFGTRPRLVEASLEKICETKIIGHKKVAKPRGKECSE